MVSDWRYSSTTVTPYLAEYKLDHVLMGLAFPVGYWEDYHAACEQLWANREGLVDDWLEEALK